MKIQATYQNGVLIPAEPLPLTGGEVTIELFEDCIEDRPGSASVRRNELSEAQLLARRQLTAVFPEMAEMYAKLDEMSPSDPIDDEPLTQRQKERFEAFEDRLKWRRANGRID